MKFKLLSLLAATFMVAGCSTTLNQEQPKEEETPVVEPVQEQEGQKEEPQQTEGEQTPVETQPDPVEPDPVEPDPVEPDPVVVTQVISFAATSGSGEHDADSLMAFMEGDLVASVSEVSKVYKSTGTSGAHPNEDGILKLGTSKANGTFTLELKEAISKIEIKCHDFYAKSDDHPTNSNAIAINGDEKLTPYNETGEGELLTWEFAEPVSSIALVANKRVYIWEITLTK